MNFSIAIQEWHINLDKAQAPGIASRYGQGKLHQKRTQGEMRMTIKGKRLSIRVAAVVVTFMVAAVTGPRQSMAASIEDVAMMKSADRQKSPDRGRQEGRAR